MLDQLIKEAGLLVLVLGLFCTFCVVVAGTIYAFLKLARR